MLLLIQDKERDKAISLKESRGKKMLRRDCTTCKWNKEKDNGFICNACHRYDSYSPAAGYKEVLRPSNVYMNGIKINTIEVEEDK